MRKAFFGIIRIICAGVVVIAILAIGQVAGLIGGKAMIGVFGGSAKNNLEQAVKESAKIINEKTPMNIDEAIVLKIAMAAQETIIYNYIFDISKSGHDEASFDKVIWLANMRDYILTDVCTNDDMKMSLEAGFNFQYSYREPNNRYIGSIKISKRDCKNIEYPK